MMAIDLSPYLDAARSHPPVHSGRRRRVVLRWHAPDVARLDALRERYKVSRATVVRALVYLGLVMAEGPRQESSPGSSAAEAGGAP